MRFPDNFLSEIRDRIPISSVIGRYVSWDKRKTQAAKGDYWACCPFHGEKTPSFHCVDGKAMYHCFGCGVSGDHFRFVTTHAGMSFPEAVEMLAGEAGVPMPARDERSEEQERQRASLYDVMDLAQGWFLEKLQSAEGARARAYLRDRRLPQRIQTQFGLGFAPDSRNGLKQFLASKGVAAEQMEQTGLVVHGDDIAVSYDRFRGRVMFPIHDSRGRVIAFGGRALSSDVPAKYLNSPETPLFSKGTIVYNHHRARKPISDSGKLIACEGYMDVIALAAAGFDNAIAPLGTALTERQLEIIWRMAPEPILCFDGDNAGIKAAHRAVDTALSKLKAGKSLRFALLPEGLDPDDVIGRSGPEAMAEILNQARPLADMLWMREAAGGPFDTPEKRAELEQRFRAHTNSIVDENVRRHYAQEFRTRLESFFGAAKKRGPSQQKTGFRGRGVAGSRLAVSDGLAGSSLVRGQTNLPHLRDAALLVAVINHPQLLREEFDSVAGLEFEHQSLSRLLSVILDVAASNAEPDRQMLTQAIEAAGMAAFRADIELLCARSSEWHVAPEAAYSDAKDGWSQALHLHHRAITLNRELKAAERAFAEQGTQQSYDRLLMIRDEMISGRGTEIQIAGFGRESGRPLKPL